MFDQIEKKIDELKIRNNKLRELRIKRVLSNSSDEFKHVFELLSLCFHINNPNLFGYVVNAPSGIVNFQLTTYQQKFLKSHGLSINDKITNHSSNINGIYIMGSTSSVAQTPKSDIDVWICYAEHLSAYALDRLNQKSLSITAWAANLNIAINCYLINTNYFSEEIHVNSDENNCGTALQMLLLDEFYRTSICLSGKPLLWLHVPTADDSLYTSTVQQLIREKIINPSEWVDFGGFSKLLANEFFGASLWQMYKAIDTPQKSLIKIMLLEAYSYFYPDIRLLSIDFKKNLVNNEEISQYCDAYMLAIRRIRKYLLKENQTSRLDFVRKCFYSKSIEGYDSLQQIPTWKRRSLKEIVKKAKWSDVEINLLHNQTLWNMGEIVKLNKLLFNNLQLCYKKLKIFAIKNNIDFSIASFDINILTRKLSANLDPANNKLELIKYKPATTIEDELHFIELTKHKSLDKGWYLSNVAKKLIHFKHRYSKYGSSLLEIFCWAYFNELYNEKTKLTIYSSNIPQHKLDLLAHDVRNFFPTSFKTPTEHEYINPPYTDMLFIAINLTKDPTIKLKHNLFTRKNNVFNLIEKKEKTIIGSIDIILHTLRGEIKFFSLTEYPLVISALNLLIKENICKHLYKNKMRIVAYAEKYSELIEMYGTKIINQLLLSPVKKITKLNDLPTMFIEESFNIYFNKLQNKLSPASKISDTTKKITKTQPKSATVVCRQDKINNNYLKKIETFAISGNLQFFFHDYTNHYHIYMLDENNQLEVLYSMTQPKQQVIKMIYGIFNENHKLEIEASGLFNFPQIYQIIKNKSRLQIVPFNSKEHLEYLSTINKNYTV